MSAPDQKATAMPPQGTSTRVPLATTPVVESVQAQPNQSNVREIKSAEPFKTTALEYMAKGWAGPIPLPPQDKFPPPRGWTGRNAPYADEAQIEKWLARKDEDGGSRDRPSPAWNPKGNIGLRLGRVTVDGVPWEIVGIDSDNYDGKQGDKILRRLERELGKLPDTWTSSARTDGASGIRYFLVPVGLAWRGNLSEVGNGVDVVQKVHRYAVVYPSWHPKGGQYLWYAPGRNPDGKPSPWYSASVSEADENGVAAMRFPLRDDPKIPHAEELPVLPDAWVEFLTRGKTKDEGVPIDMDSPDEVVDEWALENLPDEEEPCRKTAGAVRRWVTAIQAKKSSHDKITAAHWELLCLALEGHHGWRSALSEVEEAWLSDVGERGKRGRTGASGEVNRSRNGALRKVKGRADETAQETGRPFAVPECSCFNEELVKYEGITPPCSAKSPDEYRATDDGNAEHLHDLFGDDLRFVDDADSKGESWALWNGSGWEIGRFLARQCFTAVRDRQEAFVEHLTALLRDLPGGEDHPEFSRLSAQVKFWRKEADSSGSARRARNALDSYQCRPGVPIQRGAFNLEPKLLGVANGMIELNGDGFVLRPPARDDMVTYNTGVPYIPLAEQKAAGGDLAEGVRLWEDYLSTFLPDQELRHFVQKVMGYALYGENLEKKLVFLKGPGNSGKSTILESMSGSLGDYAGPFDLGKVFNGKDLNPEMALALQRRIITNTESGSKNLNPEQIKRLTGGDEVTNEVKFGNAITEKVPPFVPIIATNQVPTIEGADEALRGRLLVIPFETQVFGSEDDRSARGKIKEMCGTAVLAWMLEGWNLYCAEGLDREAWPTAVAEASKAFASELNPVARFVNECLTPDADARVRNSTIQEVYRLWAYEEDLDEKLTGRTLITALGRYGLSATKNAVHFPDDIDKKERGFLGVKIAEGYDPAARRTFRMSQG